MLEEDTQDVAMESASGAIQQGLSAVASPALAPSDNHARMTAATADQKQAGTATTTANVLDRIAGLSNILDEAHPSANATTANLHEQDIGQLSEQPEKVDQGGKSSTVALLDAILNDDDNDEHAFEPSADSARPSRHIDTADQAANDSNMQAAATSEVSHAQEGSALERRQQHTKHLPSDRAPQQVTAPAVSSPRAKGSLRDRVRALGLMKK